MSRAYRVSVSQSARKFVCVDEEVKTSIELLPILPKERLAELLGAELERRGFTVEDGHATRTEAEGVTISVELVTGEVTARSEQNVEVTRTRKRDIVARQPISQARKNEVEADLKKELETHVALEAKRLEREATQRLERALADVAAELDAAVSRVTGDALKERAAQLGEIQELSEDPETGALRIRVRL